MKVASGFFRQQEVQPKRPSSAKPKRTKRDQTRPRATDPIRPEQTRPSNPASMQHPADERAWKSGKSDACWSLNSRAEPKEQLLRENVQNLIKLKWMRRRQTYFARWTKETAARRVKERERESERGCATRITGWQLGASLICKLFSLGFRCFRH